MTEVAQQTDPQPKAEGEAEGAQSITPEEALRRFEEMARGEDRAGQQPTEPAQKEKPPAGDTVEAAKAAAREEFQRLQAEQDTRKRVDDEFASLVKTVNTGEDGKQLSDDPDEIEAWLEIRARRDPRVAKAWLNREKDPAAFQAVVQGLSKQARERFKRADAQATADREAVVSAVHNAKPGSGPPEEPSQAEISRMSDKQFNEYQKSRGVQPFRG